MLAVTAAETTAEGTTGVLINPCTPVWGCRHRVLQDNGPPGAVFLEASAGCLELLGVRKLAAAPTTDSTTSVCSVLTPR